MSKLLIVLLIAVTFALTIIFYDYFAYLAYGLDLLTASKPCIGIGNYCTYHTTENNTDWLCESGSDYLICEEIKK